MPGDDLTDRVALCLLPRSAVPVQPGGWPVSSIQVYAWQNVTKLLLIASQPRRGCLGDSDSTPVRARKISVKPISVSFMCMPRPLLSALAAGLVGLLFGLGWAGVSAASTANPTMVVSQAFDQQIKPFLANYCVGCHNGEKHKGDLDLSVYTSGSAALPKKDIWKDCAKRVLAREMPPEKERKQPSDAERAQVAAWVRSLKLLSPKDPGRGVMRRLSAVEYANTLHDLLGVDPRVADQIPQDMVGEGFNSSISPLLMEKYLLVADEVLDQLIKPDQLTMKWPAGQLDAMIGGKRDEGKADGGERRITGAGEIFALISAPLNWFLGSP